MDIKTAFLQSKQSDQPIYLLPSKEANVPSGYIGKLSKCVYGLTDASRSWYLTFREELINLEAPPLKVQPGKLHMVLCKQASMHNCHTC